MPSGRRERPFRSLRFQLTFWNTGAILLLVLATLVGLREGLRYTLRRELDALLAEDLTEVRLAVERFHPRWDQVREELDRKAVSHKARAWFVCIFRSDGEQMLCTIGAPELDVPLASIRGTPTNAERFRLVQQRLDHSGAGNLVVRVGCSQDFVDDDVANLTRIMVAIGLVFLVVAPLSGYWMAGRATRPLAAILQTASRLRPAKLDERLPVRGSGDELDRLAFTLNGLLDRLAGHLERQRAFVANAAHELRSPLASLRASADVALSHDRPAEEYRELLADMVEACDGLGSLVNQLLLLAEAEAGLPPSGGPARLDVLASRAVDMFQGIAEAREVDVRLDAPSPVLVAASDGHLRQILHNLLDNAIKFTPAGGQVTVAVRSADGRAVLSVRDTGAGIAPEDLPHVCERFYRADRARRREPGGGFGLGLSICQTLVQAHGGAITLASQPGAGTTVTVTLPLNRLQEW